MTGRSVTAVVVSYNRRALLEETLEALNVQDERLTAIVVVDNASTDGTSEFVAARWPEVDLVSLPRNTGGAGGFAVGIAHALADHDADYIWVMDDDTVPTPSALRESLDAAAASGAAVVGSRVLWTDGRDHPMNTPRRRYGSRNAIDREATMPVRSSSFVSSLIATASIRSLGLPIADYFLWNDDFEYSTRLIRRGGGVFARDSVVVHKTVRAGSTDDDPGVRFFWEVRNKVWMFRLSTSLAPWEKLLYGGATVRRWVRTVRRSRDRRPLYRELRRGLVAGLRTRPRSNTAVLAGLGRSTEVVAAAEERAR